MSILRIRTGDDITIVLTIKDANGTVLDITGGTVKFAIKKEYTDTDAAAIHYEGAATLSDPTNGKATVTITDQQSKAFDLGTWSWQVKYIDSTGKVLSNEVDKCVISENLIDDESA
jgi:hypothetical protein